MSFNYHAPKESAAVRPSAGQHRRPITPTTGTVRRSAMANTQARNSYHAPDGGAFAADMDRLRITNTATPGAQDELHCSACRKRLKGR